VCGPVNREALLPKESYGEREQYMSLSVRDLTLPPARANTAGMILAIDLINRVEGLRPAPAPDDHDPIF
jgi:hypothetical protein